MPPTRRPPRDGARPAAHNAALRALAATYRPSDPLQQDDQMWGMVGRSSRVTTGLLASVAGRTAAPRP